MAYNIVHSGIAPAIIAGAALAAGWLPVPALIWTAPTRLICEVKEGEGFTRNNEVASFHDGNLRMWQGGEASASDSGYSVNLDRPLMFPHR